MNRPFHLLIIEDNLPDIELIKIFIEESGSAYKLSVVSDGVLASDFLFRRKGFHQAAPPDLVLLDLNIPLRDGRQLLREIKSDPRLKKIPVVMLSSSNAIEEVNECYALGATAFMTKSPSLEEFQKKIKTLLLFWNDCVVLSPPPSDDIKT